MNTKRNTIRSMVAFAGIAGLSQTKWSKPIINSVISPAHAQTSCATLTSNLFSIVNTETLGFDFQISNGCPTAVMSSSSNSADLFIEFVPTTIMGTIAAISITMNYSQNTTQHSFLPDAQSNNVPFTIDLDDFEPSSGQLFSVSLQLNYFQSTGTLETAIIISPI